MIRHLLQEALGSLWHSTSLSAIVKMLETDKIQLTFSGGTQSDNVNQNKFFYLSCSRLPNGGYTVGDYHKNANCKLELDWARLSQRYAIGPVNYWGDIGGTLSASDRRRWDENEERVWLNSPSIPLRRVLRAIHVYVPPDFSHEQEKWRLKTILASDCQVIVYNTLSAYQLVDRRRAVANPVIDQKEPELYKTSWEDRSAEKLASDIDWLEDPLKPTDGRGHLYHDYWRVLEADVHNIRSAKTEAAQIQLQRLGRLLVKRRLRSIKDLVLQVQKEYQEATANG